MYLSASLVIPWSWRIHGRDLRPFTSQNQYCPYSLLLIFLPIGFPLSLPCLKLGLFNKLFLCWSELMFWLTAGWAYRDLLLVSWQRSKLARYFVEFMIPCILMGFSGPVQVNSTTTSQTIHHTSQGALGSFHYSCPSVYAKHIMSILGGPKGSIFHSIWP